MSKSVSVALLASCVCMLAVVVPACGGGDGGASDDPDGGASSSGGSSSSSSGGGSPSGDGGGSSSGGTDGGGSSSGGDAGDGGGSSSGGDAGDGGGQPGSFTVGGTVTGLDGQGLVLTKGGVDLPVNASGPFAFPAQASGSAYAVTVKTQPTNKPQTCTVANGAGTVAGANVTNVAVTCATTTFAVGGTITGLTAGTVVLTNNGADDLARTADGAFTFATQVASGAAYAVAVKTQPEGHYCYTSAASGTVGVAAVTDVAVTCATSFASCKALKAAAPSAPSGVYSIKPGAGAAYAAYCDMATDGGGWTLVMKGAEGNAFGYSAIHWDAPTTLNPEATNVAVGDAKFQAFNDLPIDEVLIQSTTAGGAGSIKLASPTAQVPVLTLTTGAYKLTNAGRAAWIASQNGATLQENCNREGFNVVGGYGYARIGLQANQENDCGSPDSVVGLGLYAGACGSNGQMSSGVYTGPSCGPHAPVANPAAGAIPSSFFLWAR